MKKLIGSTPAKITAFILSVVMVAVFLFSAFTIVLMVDYQFYFSDESTVQTEILTNMANKEANYISYRLGYGMDLEKYYSSKNVFYKIDYKNRDFIDTNYNGEEYIAAADRVYNTYSKELVEDSNGNANWVHNEIHTADISVYIAKDMKYNDMFSLASKIVHLGFTLRYFMFVIIILSFGFAVTLISYLFCAAGHNSNGEIRLNYLDKLPIDICLCFMIFLALGNFFLLGNIGINGIPELAVVFLVAVIDYFCVLGFLLSVATRIKTSTLFKNSIFYRVGIGLKNTFRQPLGAVKYTFSRLSYVTKTLWVILGIIGIEMLALMLGYEILENLGYGDLLVYIMFLNIICIVLILYFAVIMLKIKDGGERITKGELEHKIDTKYMFGDFKAFSESLNSINGAMQTAVDERMKSERFKVELITNVSHDIKTPLTSIINYVDLIKKEGTENETVQGYLEVLDRQSGKLKKLVEDLVEASKASSGNLPVNLTPCNVGVLLTQAVGEFEDRLLKADIKPVLNLTDDRLMIFADARLLWRVFDNLLSNVCKYALAGTRVYIDVLPKDGSVDIVFRNISKYELNITTEELFERFSRGDKSRNTEGHGLGLSIAKSLVELQNGNLSLSVDGDLFKASVSFVLIKGI